MAELTNESMEVSRMRRFSMGVHVDEGDEMRECFCSHWHKRHAHVYASVLTASRAAECMDIRAPR